MSCSPSSPRLVLVLFLVPLPDSARFWGAAVAVPLSCSLEAATYNDLDVRSDSWMPTKSTRPRLWNKSKSVMVCYDSASKMWRASRKLGAAAWCGQLACLVPSLEEAVRFIQPAYLDLSLVCRGSTPPSAALLGIGSFAVALAQHIDARYHHGIRLGQSKRPTECARSGPLRHWSWRQTSHIKWHPPSSSEAEWWMSPSEMEDQGSQWEGNLSTRCLWKVSFLDQRIHVCCRRRCAIRPCSFVFTMGWNTVLATGKT